jgi:hypothetical protein
MLAKTNACRLKPALWASFASCVLSSAGNFKLVGLLALSVRDIFGSNFQGSQMVMPMKFSTFRRDWWPSGG